MWLTGHCSYYMKLFLRLYLSGCYRTLYPGCHTAAWSLFSPTSSSSLAGQVHPHIFILQWDVQVLIWSLVVLTILLWILSSTAGVTAPLPGEIFTQPYKPPAFMVACILNWTGLFLVGMLFPIIVVRLYHSFYGFMPCFCWKMKGADTFYTEIYIFLKMYTHEMTI